MSKEDTSTGNLVQMLSIETISAFNQIFEIYRVPVDDDRSFVFEIATVR